MVKKAATRKPESFANFVRRIRNEKRLSLADVSKQSALLGMHISGSYINRIERNPKLKPSVLSLKALALGLGLPIEEVLTRASRTLTPDEADELFLISRYKELSLERRSLVSDLIDYWHSRDSTKSRRGHPRQLRKHSCHKAITNIFQLRGQLGKLT